MSFCSTLEIHSNCVVLGEHCSGFVVAIRAAGVLSSASRHWLGTRPSSGGGQSWWCVHTWLHVPAAGAYVVVGSYCRHTHNGSGQVSNQGQGQLQAQWKLQGPCLWHAFPCLCDLLWLCTCGGGQLQGLGQGCISTQLEGIAIDQQTGQGLIHTHKQLSVPWLLICSLSSAQSSPEHVYCIGGQ